MYPLSVYTHKYYLYAISCKCAPCNIWNTLILKKITYCLTEIQSLLSVLICLAMLLSLYIPSFPPPPPFFSRNKNKKKNVIEKNRISYPLLGLQNAFPYVTSFQHMRHPNLTELDYTRGRVGFPFFCVCQIYLHCASVSNSEQM